MNILENKIKGCLIGGAIGDALGYPFEFKRNFSKEDVINNYLENNINFISDDTQMTLFTANGILWGVTRANMRGISPKTSDCVRLAYKAWYNTQIGNREKSNFMNCWISKIKELNIQRSPGLTCLNSLKSPIDGTLENPINNSKGCGCIMRVSPVGLYFKTINEIGEAEIGKIGAETAAITHGHPLGIISTYVFTVLINIFTYENDVTIEDAFYKSIKIYNEFFNVYDSKYNIYFTSLMNKAIKLAHENIDDKEAITKIGEGWVAEETFAIALYSSIKYSNDFKSAILCSVSHDGDSDSTGSLTGNIVGNYLGFDKIPEELIEKLELKNVIIEIAEDMSLKCPINDVISDDKVWQQKYLYFDTN
jgi:ADP-ribosylglycohydrolase